VPKAGFWAIGGYKISFRADGRWYADEEAILNDKIALLFSRSLRSDGKGGWMIDVGVDRQPATVEDTPLVVVSVGGNPQAGFEVETNDAVRSELNCATLRIGRRNVLYCDVDRGERGVMSARFLRAPYYELARWIEDEGGPALSCKGVRHRLASR
jgi:hypothetical protein